MSFWNIIVYWWVHVIRHIPFSLLINGTRLISLFIYSDSMLFFELVSIQVIPGVWCKRADYQLHLAPPFSPKCIKAPLGYRLLAGCWQAALDAALFASVPLHWTPPAALPVRGVWPCFPGSTADPACGGVYERPLGWFRLECEWLWGSLCPVPSPARLAPSSPPGCTLLHCWMLQPDGAFWAGNPSSQPGHRAPIQAVCH